MSFDLAFWKQWEGHSLDSKFPLERCLGGSDHSAVFETQFQGRPAAVKIVPGKPASKENAAGLSHPALVQIFASGETALGDMRCAYIVMERADENLAEVLSERSLTPAEAQAMLFPVLGALQYLKAQGFAHGSLKPANIMAFEDQLKISSDSLVQGGDRAADCGAVGTLLQEVLGGGPNARLPEPFAEIARNCLLPNPAVRWDVTRIEAHLRGGSPPVAAARTKSWTGGWGLAAAAAAAGIVGLLVMWPSPDAKPKQNAVAVPSPPENPAPAFIAPEIKPPATDAKKAPKAAKQPKPSVAKEPASAKPPSPEQRPAIGEGITRVLPAIPQGALNTITGRVRINVRVRANSAGNVNQATVESPRASKYFTDRVLIAAQAWKFPAGDASQDWVLQFDLTREGIRVSQVKIAN